MATQTNLELPPLQELQSTKQMELLNVIDSLRAEGLSEITALPQLIVCGDQSSGKSSVLEAISGIPFPRQQGLCTRFKTEVILRRASTRTLSVSIVPSRDRTQSEKDRLLAFRHNITSTEDIPGLFKKAMEAMGLSAGGMSFSKDILRLELCGPGQPQLTLVDLPGLIQSAIGTQTQADVDMVNEMVQSYIDSDRSIILAVVNAAYDTNNQSIVRLVKQMDPTGKRILGIITKPDKVEGAEGERALLSLARNEAVKFKLGWHVVKNLDLAKEDNRNATLETRDRLEDEFFRNGFLKNLPSRDTGIARLRTRLSEILFRQIQLELPNVIKDIESRLVATKAECDKLGPSRNTIEEQRQFLIELSQTFHNICRAAIRGDYEHEFFQSVGNDESRLCADFMNKHSEFAKNLRKNGRTWKIIEEKDRDLEESRPCRTRAEAITDARKVLKHSRGRELPGMFNFAVVGELFREYSRPWRDLARAHIFSVWGSASSFLELVLRYLTDGDTCEKVLSLWLNEKMEKRRDMAYTKLDELLEVHKEHPMTMNYRLMSAIDDSALSDSDEEDEEENVSLSLDSENETHKRKSIAPSNRHPDLIAAEKAFDHMNAYYKVAMNLFMDNVPTLAVHAPIVRKLDDEFCPIAVGRMDPDMVKAIAGESEGKAYDREQTLSRLATLEAGARICRQYAVGPHSTVADRVENHTVSQERLVSRPLPTSSLQNSLKPKAKVKLPPSPNFNVKQVPQGSENNSNGPVSTIARQPSPRPDIVLSAAASSSGAPTPTISRTASPGGGGLFGKSASTDVAPTPTISRTASPGGGGLFGKSASTEVTPAATAGGFGSSRGIGLFGTSAANTTPAATTDGFVSSGGGGLFWNPPSTGATPTATAGGFGSSGGTGLFGASSANATPAPTLGSLFGKPLSTDTKPAATASAFGSSVGIGPFGASSANATPAPTLGGFGSSGGSPFGKPPSTDTKPASTSGGLQFGSKKSHLRDNNTLDNLYNQIPVYGSSPWAPFPQTVPNSCCKDMGQSILFSQNYKNFSPEELRQVYYEDTGRLG